MYHVSTNLRHIWSRSDPPFPRTRSKRVQKVPFLPVFDHFLPPFFRSGQKWLKWPKYHSESNTNYNNYQNHANPQKRGPKPGSQKVPFWQKSRFWPKTWKSRVFGIFGGPKTPKNGHFWAIFWPVPAKDDQNDQNDQKVTVKVIQNMTMTKTVKTGKNP